MDPLQHIKIPCLCAAVEEQLLQFSQEWLYCLTEENIVEQLQLHPADWFDA